MPLAVLATIATGPYISLWAMITPLVLLLLWARLLAWIDKDTETALLPREIINSGMFIGFVGGYALFFFLPGQGLPLGALLGLFVLDVGTYIGLRAHSVGLKDLKEQLADFWAGLLKKKKKEVKVAAGQVLIMSKNSVAEPVPDAESPELLRYQAAQQFLTKPLRVGAERLELVAGEPAKNVFLVDGVRYDGEVMDRNRAGAAVQFLKRVGGLDMNEHRKPQTGTFKATLDNQKYVVQIIVYGSTAGESMRLITNPQERQNYKLEALGFSDEQMAAVRKMIEDPGGVVLLSAPKGQGLTSLCYATIRGHDAFLHHVHSVERVAELELEGVTQNILPANTPADEEARQVGWVISQEPDVILMTSIESPQSAQGLAKYAGENRRAYVGFRAGSTLDALNQWRKLVGDDALAAKNLKMVIAGRLARKLCSACKVGYTPDPVTLRKLNMNPDSVGKLYQARKEPMRDAKGRPVPCTFCHDLAFKGRFGIYEILPVDEEMRSLIKTGGSDNQMKQAMRKYRGRLLQEMALAHVQAGDTSVEEILRILKTDEPPRPPGGSGHAAAPARPSPAPSGRPTSRPPSAKPQTNQ